MTNGMISISPSSISLTYVIIFQLQPAYNVYISQLIRSGLEWTPHIPLCIVRSDKMGTREDPG
jgi:hypothetical protein